MRKVIVKIEDFSKYYNDKCVIEKINLDVYKGEFLTFLGSSGCGKTTLLRSISGLDTPTTGKIFIDNVDVTNLSPPDREVNTIFQNYALFPLMSVYDNIAFGLKMKKVNKKEIDKRVNEMLDLVHLKGYEKRKPSELSGGEQQRVAISRGLVNKPKVLLLDEPLSALDLKLRKKMQIELKQLQRKLGITFIYVTHDQDEALSMSDRIVILNKGKIEQVGTPTEVYENPKSLYVANFLGEANVFEGIISDVRVKKSSVLIDNNEVIEILGCDNEINTKVNVIVRPENVKLSKTKKSINCMEGIIYELIYDGAFTKILINYNNMVVKAIISGNDKLFDISDKVYFYWTIEDSIILRCENEK